MPLEVFDGAGRRLAVVICSSVTLAGQPREDGLEQSEGGVNMAVETGMDPAKLEAAAERIATANGGIQAALKGRRFLRKVGVVLDGLLVGLLLAVSTAMTVIFLAWLTHGVAFVVSEVIGALWEFGWTGWPFGA